MSAVPADLSTWPTRRWYWVVVLIFVAHLFVIYQFSRRHDLERTPPTRTSVRFLDSRSFDASDREMLELRDPTLFALVNPHGFSGAAWLALAPFPYRMTNRFEPPRWIGPAVSGLGLDFVRFVETHAVLPALAPEKPPPRLAQITVPGPPSMIEPALRIEGDLAGRQLISTHALPPPEPGVILTNCVIRVLVDESGRTLSAVQFTSSGSPRVDEKALNFARNARFAPISGRPVVAGAPRATVGRLVFQWLGTNEPRENRKP